MPKKKAGKRNSWIILLLLAIVFALAAFCAVLLIRLDRAVGQDVTGNWVMRLDLTDHARTCANLWLREAELGERVDAADNLPRLSVEVRLTLGADGSWVRRVDRASLDAAARKANAAAAGTLRRLLLLRIDAAGRRALSDAQAEERIQKAIGMSSEDYLAQYGPALLPSAEELEERFNGSGSYRLTGGHLLFDEQRRADFLTGGGLLVLSVDGETEVYERA